MGKRSPYVYAIGIGRGFKPELRRPPEETQRDHEIDAIGSRIEPHPSGCWLWSGARNDGGYGVHGGAGAHRVVYEILVGPIPQGRHLHHKCQVPRCVNPDHLEPVTPAEHGQRHRGKGPSPGVRALARALSAPGAD